ncbi:MAG: hypothetical protein HIU84_00765 [Acidobacteria bacterium]|nr:hypothetical protein [Acidobacteriota bacterium]
MHLEDEFFVMNSNGSSVAVQANITHRVPAVIAANSRCEMRDVSGDLSIIHTVNFDAPSATPMSLTMSIGGLPYTARWSQSTSLI